MRVFVTGASGHIGSVVVRELLENGHQVVGLARSDESATAVSAAGAEVQRGSLDDLDVLSSAAAAADGVIHLAYVHDFSDYAAAGAIDLRAVEAIGAALAGSGKPFVNTSGTMMLAFGSTGQLGREDDAVDESGPRVVSENTTIALADRGVRSSVVRLSPTVHGSTDFHGFVPVLIGAARKAGQSVYVGDGANRWPAVHTMDAARLYRLAVESAPAGSRLHGAAEEGVPFRDIATVIGEQLGVPTVSITAEQAVEQLGFIGTIASMDNPTSSARTRELLGWRPQQPELLADLKSGHYFTAAS
ncbi:SDR family oxidoreductase [Mycolicibacterium sp. P9-64]|uniref:SDR family oxidoreductase n=1 Tax=Mycolicibacterium sp. P9-64 TaxID=2024612 RepID=UPI0011EF2B8B|nr:SDR family oxidoreductase [Mycolicibacterium sp. P9-64]KAA0081335.1 SDR family oxidoreductase [Mycolicibacterium sp. P9-64]